MGPTVQGKDEPSGTQELPDYYGPVAKDVLRYCRPEEGVWVDLGSGSGGVGLALARASTSSVIFIDPDVDALMKALHIAQEYGLAARVAAVAGRAEEIPLPDNSVDMVASRGSIFFWKDAPGGLREVRRILRPRARALIGGGLGSTYPRWAEREFFRRMRDGLTKQGPDALRDWRKTRCPEAFRRWARQAPLSNFEVIGEGIPLSENPRPAGGIWLLFGKGLD